MIDLNQLKNTEVSSPSDGEVLRYRGGKLRNEELRELWEDVDVLPEMENNSYYIAVGTGLWAGTTTTSHRIISVKDIRKVTITAKTSRGARYAFLRTYTAPSDADIDTAPDYVSGYTTAKEVPAGETKSVVVPADANYLYVQQSTANHNNLPGYVKFTGIGITEHTGDGSGFVKDDGSVDNSEYLTSDDVSAVAMSGDYDDLENKPNIPSVISDLNNDSGFITVNDVPKEVFVCNYTSSTSTMNKTPTAIVDAKNANKVVMCVMGNAMFYCIYASTLWILFTSANKESTVSASDIQLEYIQWTSSSNAWSHGVINLQKKLIDNGAGQNLKTINGNSVLGSGDLKIDVGDVNVQSDWNQTNNSADDFIKNKPAIPSKTSDLTNDSGFITDSDVVLVCTYNPTTRTMDKSPSDIVNAYNNGKIIIATNGDLRYYCYAAKSNLIVFRTLLGGIASSPSTGEATINVFGTRLICYVVDSWYHSDQYILQEKLTSGTNIKTINGNSLLGAGNIEIGNNVFRCLFLYVDGEGSMSDNVTPNDILDAHRAGKIVICDMITDLYSTSTIDVVMMFSAIEDGPAFTGVRDCNGQTICFKIRYDTDEREWVVSTVNIGQSPVQADWNATSGFAQILNKPTIGKVVRVCHLQQNGRLVEDKINPVRTDEELYLVTFDSNTIPSQWIVCDGDTVVDYTVPDVPISTFQQGDVCLFLGKYEIVTNPFTNNTDTSLGLKLLFHSRWGQMLSALQSAAVTIHSGSGIPDDDLGSDGDIYIMTTT